MNKYLVSIKIQDGERTYYDYFIKEGNNEKEIESEVNKMIKESSNFETEERFIDCSEITEDEIETLDKFSIL